MACHRFPKGATKVTSWDSVSREDDEIHSLLLYPAAISVTKFQAWYEAKLYSIHYVVDKQTPTIRGDLRPSPKPRDGRVGLTGDSDLDRGEHRRNKFPANQKTCRLED